MEELDVFIKSNPDPRELKRAMAVRMALTEHPLYNKDYLADTQTK